MQAAWMIAAAFFFSSMAVGIKFASEHFGQFEIVMYRGLIGTLVMVGVCRMQNVALATRMPWMHVWRNAVGVTAMMAWFYAIAHLPLATALTLNHMSGLWVAAFLMAGTLIARRWDDLRRQSPLALAIVASFTGVLLMLRPTVNPEQLFPGLIGLASGIGAALAVMQVAAMAKLGEPESRIVFYFSVSCTLVGLVGAVITQEFHWKWPQGLWLLGLGILAALGQICLTRAYTRGSTIVVANLQYVGIVFAAIYGALLFGERIPLLGWLGIGLIVASGITATLMRNRVAAPRQSPPKPAPDSASVNETPHVTASQPKAQNALS